MFKHREVVAKLPHTAITPLPHLGRHQDGCRSFITEEALAMVIGQRREEEKRETRNEM